MRNPLTLLKPDVKLRMHPIIEKHLKTLNPQEAEEFEDELMSVFLECIAEEMEKESDDFKMLKSLQKVLTKENDGVA
jgi:hypothetical protein